MAKIMFTSRLYMVLGTVRAMSGGDAITPEEIYKFLRERSRATGDPCTLSLEEVSATLDRMAEAKIVVVKPSVRLTPGGAQIADHLDGINVWGGAFTANSKEMLCWNLFRTGQAGGLLSQTECAELLGCSTTAVRAGMGHWINKGEVVAERHGTQVYYRKTTPEEVSAMQPPTPTPTPTPAPAATLGNGNASPDPLAGFRQIADLLGIPLEDLLETCLRDLQAKIRAQYKGG